MVSLVELFCSNSISQTPVRKCLNEERAKPTRDRLRNRADVPANAAQRADGRNSFTSLAVRPGFAGNLYSRHCAWVVRERKRLTVLEHARIAGAAHRATKTCHACAFSEQMQRCDPHRRRHYNESCAHFDHSRRGHRGAASVEHGSVTRESANTTLAGQTGRDGRVSRQYARHFRPLSLLKNNDNAFSALKRTVSNTHRDSKTK